MLGGGTIGGGATRPVKVAVVVGRPQAASEKPHMMGKTSRPQVAQEGVVRVRRAFGCRMSNMKQRVIFEKYYEVDRGQEERQTRECGR